MGRGPGYNIIPGDWGSVEYAINDLCSRVINEDTSFSDYILADGSRVYTGTGVGFIDEDNMVSDSAVATASQQSVKAYIDNSIGDVIDTLTDGGVCYVNASDKIDTDANLTWDYTNLKLGIGGAILATGTYGSGWTEPDSGAGTRMLWYPRKSAFRAGSVDGTQWDDDNIGNYSIAGGFNVTATAASGVSIGDTISNSGTGSKAFGTNITLNDSGQYAIGSFLTVTAARAMALGFTFTNSTTESVGIGIDGLDLLITSGLADFQDTDIETTGDITTTGDVIIDSDTGGLKLGAIQDATLKWDDDNSRTDLSSALKLGGDLVIVAGGKIRPTTDGTTAINIAKADGTDFIIFDTTNLRMGLGAAPASYPFEVHHSAASAAFRRYNEAAAARGAFFIFGRARGSVGSPDDVNNGDQIAKFLFSGYHTSWSNAAEIEVVIDGAPGDDDMPGRLNFKTTPDGSDTPVTRLTIGPDGTVDITGASTFGDGGTTNYTGISTTGAITQHGSATASFNATTITALTVDSPTLVANIPDYTDKVGVGTATPQVLFHVNGIGAFGDSVTTALATKALNLIGTNATMKIRMHSDSSAASVALHSYETNGTTLTGYWDFYVGPKDTLPRSFVIRDRTDGNLNRLVIDSSGNVGIGTDSPDTKLQVVGDCKFGDDNTNYTQFSTVGLQTMVGTARVTNALWIGAEGLRAPPTKAADFVDHGNFGAWEFSDGTDDTIVANMRIPNRMDRNVVPTVSLGWSAPAAGAGNAEWQVEYLWTAIDGNTAGAVDDTLTVVTAGSATTANGMTISTVTLAAPIGADVCLHLRIKRLAAGGSDDTVVGVTHLHGICMNFTSNKLGTATS